MTTKDASPASAAPLESATDFVRQMVAADVASGKHGGKVATRFPPEPNGYLHIGHAKAICLDFGLAKEWGGTCNLRMDDTNPTTEDPEYVASIQNDVRWLGFEWSGMFYASDYFQQLYDFAVQLIEKGRAYVCSSNEDEIRALRGTVTQPGQPSPYRNRSIAENLDLFARMKAGEFADGAHVLRAKIDMTAANMKMRDPLLYRIRHAHHYRTGDAWCIYPMYDFAHGLSDYIEGITHSLCTLEFENNRELYDWILEALELPYPRPGQTEFARLNLSHTVLSKRKLLQLVEEKRVSGWDDPRMPTIAGLRRRGFTPESIRRFCDDIGVAKANSTVDAALLEHAIRDDLNPVVPRVMAVLRPLRVVIENYPEGQTEVLDAPYYPRDVPKEGSRPVPFSRVLYIERYDFREDPPKGFFRLAPGREVRLRYAYLVRCVGVVKNENGEVIEVRCTYDPETRGGSAPDGRKVEGTIHWVSAEHSLPATVRLYDRLFRVERPDLDKSGDFLGLLNPASLEELSDVRLEPSLAEVAPGERFQFERQGYFFLDPIDSTPERPVYSRIVPLRDSWARLSQEGARGASLDEGETSPRASKPKREKAPVDGSISGERPSPLSEGDKPPKRDRSAPEMPLSDDEQAALAAAIGEVLAAHPGEIASFHAGKTNLLGFFVGKVMQRLDGRISPRAANAAIQEKLTASN